MPSILVLVAVAAVDSGVPLITDWAEPPTYTYNGRITCDQPDAGIKVTVFREPEWSTPGDACDFSPLTCSTPAARDEVLRQVKAGALRFPKPAVTVHPDADGWLRLPVRNDDTLLVECGDLVEVVPAWPLRSMSIHLTRDTREKEALSSDITRLIVVNPFTREVRDVTREEFVGLPARVTARAWAVARRSSTAWSDPVTRLYFGETFPPPGPPTINLGQVSHWGFDGGTPVAVIVNAPELTPSNLGIVITRPDSNRPVAANYTHANHARFGLLPGRWAISVKMNGAAPISGEFTVTDQPRNFVVPLSRGYAGRVVDEAGKPVERACLSFEESGTCRAWSARDGRFALEFQGALPWIRATHPFIGNTSRMPFKFGVPITLKLRAERRVVLRVARINGRPARGWLEVDPVDVPPGFESPQPPTYPAFEGDLTLADLSPGKHTIFLSVPGHEPQTIEVQVPAKGVTTVRVPAWKPSPPQ